jgi:hypothetical protein
LYRGPDTIKNNFPYFKQPRQRRSKDPKAPKLLPLSWQTGCFEQVQLKDAESIPAGSGSVGKLSDYLETKTRQDGTGSDRNVTSQMTALKAKGKQKLVIPRVRSAGKH